jgi:hypothetical protein
VKIVLFAIAGLLALFSGSAGANARSVTAFSLWG